MIVASVWIFKVFFLKTINCQHSREWIIFSYCTFRHTKVKVKIKIKFLIFFYFILRKTVKSFPLTLWEKEREREKETESHAIINPSSECRWKKKKKFLAVNNEHGESGEREKQVGKRKHFPPPNKNFKEFNELKENVKGANRCTHAREFATHSLYAPYIIHHRVFCEIKRDRREKRG